MKTFLHGLATWIIHLYGTKGSESGFWLSLGASPSSEINSIEVALSYEISVGIEGEE